MSIKHKLRMLLLCLPLLAGCLSGVPMRPEDIEKLMNSMNRERIECVMFAEGEGGPIKDSLQNNR